MYKSFAQWDHLDVITVDEHLTESEAKAVCQLLEEEGYGGMCQYYPKKTWIEKINDPTTDAMQNKS